MSINKAIITGNLARSAELRSTQSGVSVSTFTVAVNERVKNHATGEYDNRANWIDCTMFGKRAESLNQYLTKGQKVAVEGRLRWSQWEKDGVKHSKIGIVVDEIDLGGARKSSEDIYPEDEPQSYSVYDKDIAF